MLLKGAVIYKLNDFRITENEDVENRIDCTFLMLCYFFPLQVFYLLRTLTYIANIQTLKCKCSRRT